MTTINAIQGKSLYTELEVGGTVTRFLVDSGAEISILPEGHALLSKNCVLKGASMHPVLVDGSELPVKGVVLGSVVLMIHLLMLNFMLFKPIFHLF